MMNSTECRADVPMDRTANSVAVSNANVISEIDSSYQNSSAMASNSSTSQANLIETSEKSEEDVKNVSDFEKEPDNIDNASKSEDVTEPQNTLQTAHTRVQKANSNGKVKNEMDYIEKEFNNLNPSCSKEEMKSQSVIQTAHAGVLQEDNTSRKCQPKQNLSKQKSKHCSPRKHRVKHKRKWKPYTKLTWNERRKLEERDSRRASRIREEMSSCGLALAPYNTTQFIMEDHNIEEPMANSDPEELHFVPSNASEYFEQQFEEAFNSVDDDFRNEASKYDLVCELMRVEDEVEQLEKTLNETRKEKVNQSEDSVEADLQKIRVFQEEIEKMTHENEDLSSANYRLYEQLDRMS
ncbi:protein HEXIM1-like [Uloborus diversus]|uniref:protein HEXIM1-like n=1 Tax=Uloborus diversus TaxID=327109 RepID=UPI0024094F94|nr:protein HEXIM1-like [Uloborus diversus]